MARLEPGEHLDPTSELTLETIKQKAISGVAALLTRNFLLQTINFLGFALLSGLLEPAQLGVFFLVSAVINFLAYFSDIGLAAALIQKKERVTREDLNTTFTVQQALVVLLLIILVIATPFLMSFYNLSHEGALLVWALGFSLLLSSLKTIPSVLLERGIEFKKLAIPPVVEAVLFNSVAVYMAWRGFGITSFIVAVLIRGIAGLILIYILRPWKPGFAFSKDSLRGLLHFGIPYQANTFLAVAKDDGMVIVLGRILGASGIGLLGWAQKWALAPLRFFMDVVIKVTFPAYARIQDNKKELSAAVSKSVFFVCLLSFPAIVGLVLVAPPLVEAVTRYRQWQPALLALGLYSINAAWGAVTTPLTNLLNAIGRITTTLRLMIMWTGLTWLFVPGLAILYGISGAAAGAAIVGTSSIVAIYIVRRYVSFDLLGSVGKPLLASVVMGLVVLLLRGMVPVSTLWVLFLVASGIAAYAALIYLLVGPSILLDARKVIHAIRKR